VTLRGKWSHLLCTNKLS